MSKGQQKRWEDPIEHEKARNVANKQWENPLIHKKAKEAQIKRWEDPLEREKARYSANKRWEDPLEREKASVTQIKMWENPVSRERTKESANKRWEDSEQREKASAAKQHIPYEDWEEFVSNSLYCPDFNEECKESNREKYDRKCFLTDLPEEENITSTGKQQKLSVHHVDMDKGQGCDGKRWKLVPVCLKWHGKVHNGLWESRIIWLLDNVWNSKL